MASAGDAGHVLPHLMDLVPPLERVPGRLRDAPPRRGVLIQLFQAFLLFLLGEIKPELEDQGTFIGEHLLEAIAPWTPGRKLK